MSKTNNNITVDGIGFHRGELARYKSADELVEAFKADKTYAHIFETDGGEQALRTAYEKAAPKKEAEVSGDGSESGSTEGGAQEQESAGPKGRKRNQQ